MGNTQLLIVLFALLLQSMVCYSSKLCFSFAQTYYEQLYCEIKARGKGSRLPVYYEFQRNNTITQALLLKRHAKSIGINIVMPKTADTAQKTVAKTLKNNRYLSRETNKEKQQTSVTSSTGIFPECTAQKNIIKCVDKTYQLVGNQANTQLNPNVFSADFTMDIPAYNGSINDADSIDQFLLNAYSHYLSKMLAIGLGGSTLSYQKFAYLFDDIYKRKINFSERFETMFYYLKKDKQSMAVNSQLVPPSPLLLADCYPIKNMIVCASGKKNYLYLQKK